MGAGLGTSRLGRRLSLGFRGKEGPEGLSQDTAEGMEKSGEVRGRFRKKS